jgi:hypothetical protein
MKQDEVLQTLREVIEEAKNFTTWTVSTPHLVELVKRAVEAEREACAKVCDARYMGDNNREDTESRRCAEAIRARGNT